MYTNYVDFNKTLKEIKKNKEVENKVEYGYNSCEFSNLDELNLNSNIHNMLSKYNLNYFDILRQDYGAYYFENGKLYIAHKLPKIEHEVAHIVYMNNFNRLLLSDFGFITYDFNYVNKLSDNLILKILIVESKVRGIQSHLSEYSTQDLKSWFSMQTTYNCLGRDRVGKFTIDELEDYLTMLFEREASLWSLEKIKKEFDRRMNFVFSFLEKNKNYSNYSNNYR